MVCSLHRSPFIVLASLISVFASAEESVNGLNMEIYSDTSLGNLVSRQITPNIDFQWAKGRPVEGVAADNFSVRLSGWIRAPKDGQYRIVVAHDDGLRLWINKHQVIDQWKPSKTTSEVIVQLTKEPQPIGVEYYEGHNFAHLTMLWQPVGGTVPGIVPPEAFFPTAESAASQTRRNPNTKTGLRVQYFNPGFTRQLGTGRLDRLETNPSSGAPAFGLPANARARYAGFIVPPVDGQYQFLGWADDRLRVWIDDSPLLDFKWKKNAKPERAFIQLQGGHAHAIRAEFVDSGNLASWFLHWIPPGGDTEVSVPSERIFQSKRAADESELAKNKK